MHRPLIPGSGALLAGLAAIAALLPTSAQSDSPNITFSAGNPSMAPVLNAPVARTLSWSCDDPSNNWPLTQRCRVYDVTAGAPGSGLEVLVSDADCGTAPTDPTSVTYNYDVPGAALQTDHQYYYQAYCRDSTAWSYWRAMRFFYDASPPTVTLVSGPATPASATAATFTFTCADTSFGYDLSGTTTVPWCHFFCALYDDTTGQVVRAPAACDTWQVTDAATLGTHTYSGLGPGNYRFEVFGKDLVALQSATRSYPFTVQLSAGAACTSGTECASGFCADGLCCDSACGGSALDDCQACSLAAGATANGVCALLPSGVVCRGAVDLCDAPEKCGGVFSTCPADAKRDAGTECRPQSGVCDVPEACDGVGNTCPTDVFALATTSCRAPSCSGAAPATATLAATCTGTQAACPAVQTQACAPYLCGAAACAGNCGLDTDCQAGHWCSAGVCAAKTGTGNPCTAANQCTSGFCADGVCCDEACAGQCEACAEAAQVGTCTTVSGAPRTGRPACASDGTVCGGACGGTNATACTYPQASLPCRGASCAGVTATLATNCDGLGTCPAIQTQACGEYLCGATACLGNCTSEADCAAGRFCSAGVCVPKKPAGATCAATAECTSGFCADRVCCNTACDGQCEACDTATASGACIAVSGAPHAGRAVCAGTGDCQGSCDGTSRAACVLPGAAKTCAQPACVSGQAVGTATCDGKGKCQAPPPASCGEYRCSGGACLTSCTADPECVDGMVCSGGTCGVKANPPAGCGCGTGQGAVGLVGFLLLAAFTVGARRRATWVRFHR